MINLDEIRKEIGLRHGVMLEDHDPLVMIASMVDLLLNQCTTQLNDQQEAHLKTLINHAQQVVEKNRTASMEAAKKGVLNATEELSGSITRSMDEGREHIRKELQYAWGKIEESRKAASMASFIAAGCAAISIISTVITIAVISS